MARSRSAGLWSRLEGDGVLCALLAAAFFGASTPLAKPLAGEISPWLMAGLLYLGSGFGLAVFRLIRDRGWASPRLGRHETSWLLAAIVAGGIAAPVLMMYGLSRVSGATASLLLNFEAVFTAAIAWLVFRESADRRIVAGMLAIVAGGIVLSWPSAAPGVDSSPGFIAVVSACLCWAVDNNLTRNVSASDAAFIACIKGLVAGTVNTVLAMILGAADPGLARITAIMAIGLAGYGVSLVLFVLALRALGTARTGAYFSTAPFVGAFIALVLQRDSVGPAFWLAGAFMAAGVWLHLTESHVHLHEHEPLVHRHRHRHDAHHRHEHDFEWDGTEPHDHEHVHERLVHEHLHVPDIHHRHTH